MKACFLCCALALALLSAAPAAAVTPTHIALPEELKADKRFNGPAQQCITRMNTHAEKASSVQTRANIVMFATTLLTAVASGMAGFLKVSKQRKVAAVIAAISAVLGVIPKLDSDPAELAVLRSRAERHWTMGLKLYHQLAFQPSDVSPDQLLPALRYISACFIECGSDSPSAEVKELPSTLNFVASLGPAAQHRGPEFPGYAALAEDVRAFELRHGFSSDSELTLPASSPAAACAELVTRAQWREDVIAASESASHFDNCNFDGALALFDAYAARAEALAPTDPDAALTYLGRALHVLQDFYLHSNYLELMAERQTPFDSLAPVRIWEKEGAQQVRTLAGQGLVSGRVPWADEDRCAAGAPTHEALNKDTPRSSRGGQVVASWNRNYFTAAQELLDQASRDFLRYTLGKPAWKEVASRCETKIAFLPGADQRNHGGAP